jgi:hypothetical protein
MEESVAKYRRLDSQKIVETVEILQSRIEERFPGCGLSKLAAELLRVSEETVARTHWILKANLALRCGAVVLSIAIIALVLGLLVNIRQFQFNDYVSFIQALDSTISSVVFIGAAILFLLSWENRIKRARALKAIHELRAMAHIVDMHQLTKDPESYFSRGTHTSALQRRAMTPFELNRYLDYCSELLALISKIAAIYVQGFQDSVLLDAVDDVEDLTSGFSRKIWQKITILEYLMRSLPSDSARNSSN